MVQIEVFLAKAFSFIPHDEEDMLSVSLPIILPAATYGVRVRPVRLTALFHHISMARWQKRSSDAKSYTRKATSLISLILSDSMVLRTKTLR